MDSLVFTLAEDKVTKNDVHRFNDGNGHNIYLQPDELKKIGNPKKVKLTVAAA